MTRFTASVLLAAIIALCFLQALKGTIYVRIFVSMKLCMYLPMYVSICTYIFICVCDCLLIIAKASKMFMIKSSDKLELLRQMLATIIKSQTWVGLSDVLTEGEYVWADGEPAKNVSFPIPWNQGTWLHCVPCIH